MAETLSKAKLMGLRYRLKENEKTCIVCGATFRRRGKRKYTAKFCSKKCYARFQKGRPTGIHNPKRGEIKKCKWCNEKFYTRPAEKNQKFCQAKCYYKAPREWLKGKNNYNWKGGITPENQRERKSRKYVQWRRRIFKRDNYTCQMCRVRGGKLEADHIQAWAAFPKERFKISNGRTLCRECHKKTPNYKRLGTKK